MNTNVIARPDGHLGQATAASEYFMVSNLLAGVPQTQLTFHQVDAIIAWPGIIFDAAIRSAVSKWNTCAGNHLLIAGYHLEDVAKEAFQLEALPKNYGLNRLGSICSQILAVHAGHQASWCADMVTRLGIKSLALYVPGFHLPRAYLTMIEALRRVGLVIPMIPVAPFVSPFAKVVLDTSPGGTRTLTTMDVIHAEVTRMAAYSKPKADGSPGDVATTEAFVDYMEWLYEQPLITTKL